MICAADVAVQGVLLGSRTGRSEGGSQRWGASYSGLVDISHGSIDRGDAAPMKKNRPMARIAGELGCRLPKMRHGESDGARLMPVGKTRAVAGMRVDELRVCSQPRRLVGEMGCQIALAC